MPEFEKTVGDIYLLKVPFSTVWTGIVLVDGEDKILIDSGDCAARIDDTLLPALEKHGLKLSDIGYLLCTHTHGDHVGGHSRIHELAPDIKIISYEKSAPKMRDPLKYSKAIRATFPEYSPEAPASLRGVEPDAIVGDYATVCGRMQLIPTPGHDTDTVCWLDNVSGTLICGDSLQANGTDTQGIGLYMDLPSYRETLLRLEKLGAENLITGHEYLPVGNSAYGVAAVKRYIADCAALVEFYDGYIRAMHTAGKTPAETARALIAEVKGICPSFLFLPLYTVTSHIREIK